MSSVDEKLQKLQSQQIAIANALVGIQRVVVMMNAGVTPEVREKVFPQIDDMLDRTAELLNGLKDYNDE